MKILQSILAGLAIACFLVTAGTMTFSYSSLSWKSALSGIGVVILWIIVRETNKNNGS